MKAEVSGINSVRQLGSGDLGSYVEYVRSSQFGDVLQTPAWARLKSEAGWKPHYMLSEASGKPDAACLALEKPIPRTPFSILYCPRGPVLDWAKPDALASITQALHALAKQRRSILVKIDPPVPESSSVKEALHACGYHHIESEGFGGTQPKCVMKLDLSGGLDAVFEGFKPKWRYNVRLAERKGVIVSEADEAGTDSFYDILIETAKRDRFLVRSRQYFHTMWRELSKEGLIKLFLANYEGRPIAGALMYVFGEQAWYTYGASSNEHRNVMPNHLMQWAMIQEAARLGCKIYDFRGVSCNQEAEADDHLQGLNRFKTGFGAQFVSYVGEFDLIVNPPMYFAWTKLAPRAMALIKRKARQQAAD